MYMYIPLFSLFALQKVQYRSHLCTKKVHIHTSIVRWHMCNTSLQCFPVLLKQNQGMAGRGCGLENAGSKCIGSHSLLTLV